MNQVDPSKANFNYINLKTDWKNDPVAGIDWNSVPVVQDAHEIKLRDELNKTKLDLKIEQKKTDLLVRNPIAINLELYNHDPRKTTEACLLL